MREQMLASAMNLLSMIDDPTSASLPRIATELGSLMRDPTFDPIENDIIGTSNLRILRNQELVKMLSNWSSDVYQVQEMELEYQKMRTEIGIPLSIDLGIARNLHQALWTSEESPEELLDEETNEQLDIGATKKEISLSKLLASTELEGFIASSITWNKLCNMQSEALKKRILRILQLVDEGIEG